MVFCEICHNVRKSFNLHQLAQVVSFLACTIADRSQVYNHQSTCVRLSLNLVECIYQVRLAGAAIASGYSARTWLTLCYAVSTDGWVCSWLYVSLSFMMRVWTFLTSSMQLVLPHEPRLASKGASGFRVLTNYCNCNCIS